MHQGNRSGVPLSSAVAAAASAGDFPRAGAAGALTAGVSAGAQSWDCCRPLCRHTTWATARWAAGDGIEGGTGSVPSTGWGMLLLLQQPCWARRTPATWPQGDLEAVLCLPQSVSRVDALDACG